MAKEQKEVLGLQKLTNRKSSEMLSRSKKGGTTNNSVICWNKITSIF